MATEGYILRIAKKEWVEKVFNSAMYYTGARRKWQTGQTILFVGKTEFGDAFIGYGRNRKCLRERRAIRRRAEGMRNLWVEPSPRIQNML
jgi:hypothetical protein